MGMKPKVHSEIYKRVNTLLVFLSRLPRRMEAKKMALMLVGLPYWTTFTFVLSYFFSALASAGFVFAGSGTPETPDPCGD